MSTGCSVPSCPKDVGGFSLGLLGACYDGTGNPSMLALHKGNHVISIEGLYVNHFDLIMGKILRIIFICTIVPGIIIWAIGRHLANSDPEAIGNSRIRMVIAMDRLLCERKDHWEEKVELIAKQCGIKCSISEDSYTAANLEKYSREGLRDATQIRIVRKLEDGTFNAHTYEGETLTRAIKFNLDLLNDFSNVTEIVLQNDFKSNWKGVVDLSSLTHVKKLICENFSLSSGYVKSCPYVEEVILKNSVIYTERGVDCTQCQNLKKVTFDNCCEIRNGLTYISYGVTLPENRNVAVVITGKWNVNNDLMNIFRRFYYGSPCAGFIYDDATASFGGTMQPIAMLSRQSSVLCTARSVWINVDYENGTAWGIRDAEGGDSGPLDRISGLDEINQYPNIQKIVVRDGKRDKPLDLSCLSSIHEFECTNFTIQSGGIIFGPRAEKITINRSPMGDYPNCTRCVYLKEVHIIACSRGSLHGYPIFTGMGMEDMATEASGLRGIDLPNDHLKQITVHVGGQWYENILNALLSNLYAIGVKYVHSGATSIPLAEEKWTFRFNPMQNMDEQCKLLDIDPREYSTLTAGKIKRNYKKKAFELHPDRNGNTPEATETFHAMRNAFMQICKDKNWMDLIPSEKQNKTF
ncbi:MAG: J domain-containing protein [Puniceicoccales bacterium]|nr:J domain-containing protein [Puniceicoccales bacterium]